MSTSYSKKGMVSGSRLLKIVAALCITGIGVPTKAFAGDIAFSRSKILDDVLTKGQFGVSAVVDINRDGKADIVLDNGKWYEGPNWVPHSYSSRDSRLRTESTLWRGAIHDIDGDGDIDVFGGHCNYKHGDPGEKDPPDIFWLELVRSGTSVKWVKHQLASDFNLGFGCSIGDVDNDGDPDLVAPGMGHSRAIPAEADVLLFTTELQ